MRWIPGGRSRNLEDRRGASPGGLGGGGFGGGGAKLGVGGMLILAVLSMVFGRDLVSEYGGGAPPTGSVAPNATGSANGQIADASEENMVLFVSSVLDSTQGTWQKLMSNYTDAKL